MATRKQEAPALPTSLEEIMVENLPTASFDDRLIAVQHELKAPKGQYNSFGKYAYRNAEDILEAVKPLLKKYSLRMTISDTIHSVEANGMMYVEATVSVTDGHTSARVSAQAGIDPNRKGMDIAQSFGSSSSYARKYALNGMFLIDDTKDADATNTHGKGAPVTQAPVKQPLTTEIIDRMKTAVEFGKAEDVRTALVKYAATEEQIKQIFG
jgi:hypothetical protein